MAVIGFTGTVSDTGFSRIHALGLPRVAVESPTAWAPTPTGTARQVSFAAGNGRILGLRDERSGAFTVQNATNSSGSDRYDIIVMRADFTAGTVTPTAITGTPGAGIPPAITKSLLVAGAVYDFPLVVCKTISGGGVYSGGDLFDLRCWGGNGGLTVAQGSYIASHDLVPGQRWTINGTSLSYIIDSSGGFQLDSSRRFAKPTQTGTGSLTANTTATIATVSVPDPGTSYRLRVWAQLNISTPTAAAVSGSIQVTHDSTVWDTNRIGDTIGGIGYVVGANTECIMTPQLSASLTGAKTVRLLCRAGASSITVDTANYNYYVEQVPSLL